MSNNFRSPSNVAKRFKHLPAVVNKVINWPQFMHNYAWGLEPKGPYLFRNGAQIKIARAIDHVPIMEVFLRKDYGQIPDNSTILDVGASMGVFSIYAATSARNVKIYAFEPCNDSFDLMLENVRANHQEGQIKCFNLAVAADSQPRILFLEDTAFFFPTLIVQQPETSPRQINVSCITLEEIIEANDLKKIDLLKMDCEGSEYEILYSTPETSFRRISEIRLEYHNLDVHRRNVESLQDFLKCKSYAVTYVKANSPTNGSLWATNLNNEKS